MKRTVKYLLIALCMCLSSCYKDQSTPKVDDIPEITITGLPQAVYVQYGETVTLDAHVSQIGRTNDDFDFKWEMDALAGVVTTTSAGYVRIEMGTTTHFEFTVTTPPSSSPYMITFEATDKKSGITAIASCAMYVTSALSEGLLIGYTNDGGSTSEIDLASNQSLTYDYKGEGTRYTRRLISLGNEGAALEGRIGAITQFVGSNGSTYNDPGYIVGTDKHLIAYDNLSFKEKARDKENFSLKADEGYNTTFAMTYASYCTAIVLNGDIYACNSILDNVFSKVLYTMKPSSVFGPSNVSGGSLDQCDLTVFDPGNGYFSYMLGWRTGQGGLGVVSTAFPFSLVGSTCLGAGGGKLNNSLYEQYHNFLIKDASGTYRLVRVDGRNNKSEAYQLDGDGLDNFVSFASCDNVDICYYCTDKDIYAILLTGGKAITKKIVFSPENSSERITMLKHYKQGWYGVAANSPSSYMFQLPTNRLQILVVTHNDSTGEGKVYLKPFNVSTGLFTINDNGVLTVDGEITALSPSMR